MCAASSLRQASGAVRSRARGTGPVLVVLCALALTGLGSALAQTTRVSVSSGSAQGNGPSGGEAISDDGRYVAFTSWASNLVPFDTNGESDVFVHDRQTGQTRRVSVSSGGSQATGVSDSAAISGNGRWIAFRSFAPNLVAGDTNGWSDIFVHDRIIGATTRVSVASSGGQANSGSSQPRLSADGQYAVFRSSASNLVSGDTNGANDIFLHDQSTRQTTRVSVSSSEVEGNGNSSGPAVDATGTLVAFHSHATNLVSGDTNGVADVFVRGRTTGQTIRVSVGGLNTQANGDSRWTGISDDGRYVVFDSVATNLVPEDTNGFVDAFVRDLRSASTARVSVSTGGAQGNADSGGPTVSPDGRYVLFGTAATNLSWNDTNGVPDMLLHDRVTGETGRVSVGTTGAQGNDDSLSGDVGAYGLHVAFMSHASNLVSGDTNGWADVFARSRPPQPPELLIDLMIVAHFPPKAGQPATIHTTVQNVSATPAPSCTLAVWRHRSGPPGPGASGDYSHATGPLGPGEKVTFQDTFTPTYPGSRWAWAYVDPDQLVTESSESNNIRSISYTIEPTDADLVWQLLGVTPNPVSLGNQATITATVRNNGTDPAPEFLVQLWRHREAQPVLGTTGDYTHTCAGLVPGASETFTSMFYPHYQGPRTAWGLIDSRNVVAESEEGNNKLADVYSIQPGITPDLLGNVTITPDPVTLGSAVELAAHALNIGPVASGPFTLAAWRHKTDAPIIGSPPDYTWSVTGRGPGEGTTRTASYTPSYPGARTAWVLADSNNVVIENNEGNNVSYDRYGIVTGDEPDLGATIAVTPDPVTVGATATMTVQVQNAGSSAAGLFHVGLWAHRASPPGVGTPPWLRVGVASLAPSASATLTPTFTPNFAGGRTAWAFADNEEQVLETNEGNNWASDGYTIVDAGGAGALAVSAAGAETTGGGQVAISYCLSAPADVEVGIRNVAGRLVARVRAGEREAGSNTETWNGLGSGGARVPAGVYLCEIVARTDEGQSTRAVASVRVGR